MAATRYNTQGPVLVMNPAGLTAGDTYYINQFADVYTSGTDLSAQDILLLVFGPGFKGTAIGSGKFTVVADTGGTSKVVNQMSGPRLELVSTGSTAKIQTVENDPSRSDHVFTFNTADCETLYSGNGTADCGAALDLNNVWCLGGKVVLNPSSYKPALIVVIAGTCEASRDFDAARVGVGGTLLLLDVSCTPSGAIAMNGGTLKIVECGTIASLVGDCGVVDITELRRNITITASTRTKHLRIRFSKKNTFTVTWNATDILGGPTLEPVD